MRSVLQACCRSATRQAGGRPRLGRGRAVVAGRARAVRLGASRVRLRSWSARSSQLSVRRSARLYRQRLGDPAIGRAITDVSLVQATQLWDVDEVPDARSSSTPEFTVDGGRVPAFVAEQQRGR